MRRPYLKFFFRTFGWFTALMLPIVTAYILIDPLHALRFHEEQNPITYEYSRAISSINYFDHYNDSIHYDSFNIGSSVAGCYNINYWKTYLPEGAEPIHINNSCQTTHQLLLNCQYIATKAPMHNVLIALTPRFAEFSDISGPQFTVPIQIQPTIIDKAGSWFRQFKFTIDRRTLLFFFCKKCLHLDQPKESTLGWHEPPFDFEPQQNIFYCEVKDKEMRQQGRNFINDCPNGPEIMKAFPLCTDSVALQPEQVEDLKSVKAIIEQQHSNYNVVMSPAIHLIPTPELNAQLFSIFGRHYIDLSSEFGFYFFFPGYARDNIHPMPELTRILLDRIYGDPSPNAAVPL